MKHDASPGCLGVAQRTVNAERRFVEFACAKAGLSEAEAYRALATYKKARAIKIDRVTGQFQFTHGAFAEADVLRKAALT